MPITTFTISVKPHADTGSVIRLEPFVRQLNINRTMTGQPGTWSASLNFSTGSKVIQQLRGVIRDDDWVEIRVDRDGRKGYMLGTVDSVDPQRVTDPASGNINRAFTISGRDWGRMLATEIRINSILALASRLPSTVGDVLSQELMDLFASGGPQSGPSSLLTTDLAHPTIPGIIDERLMSALTQAARVDQKAWIPIKHLLELCLYGTWHDPAGPSGRPLLQRLSWERFGSFAGVEIIGEPWQLINIQTQGGMTPYGMLQTFGNTTFNEAFHGYVGDAPAIVFRERPYDGQAWQTLLKSRMKIGGAGVASNASRNGSERFTYTMLQGLDAALNGQDMAVDTLNGRLPIIDLSKVGPHGIRALEPSDDYWCPRGRSDEETLEHHYRMALKLWGWYYNNSEHLSGSTSIAPAVPDLQPGTVIEIPFETSFRQSGQTNVAPNIIKPVESIAAYVTGTQERYNVNPRSGEVTGTTDASWIRGQPVSGLPVPNPDKWL